MNYKQDAFTSDIVNSLNGNLPALRRALAENRLHYQRHFPVWYNFCRAVFLFNLLEYFVYRFNAKKFKDVQLKVLTLRRTTAEIIAEIDQIYFYPNPRVLDKDEAYADWYAEVVRIVFKRQEIKTHELVKEMAIIELEHIKNKAAQLISST